MYSKWKIKDTNDAREVGHLRKGKNSIRVVEVVEVVEWEFSEK